MARDSGTRGRYAECETEDGNLTIYDTDNDRAWVRSDTSVVVAWQT